MNYSYFNVFLGLLDAAVILSFSVFCAAFLTAD